MRRVLRGIPVGVATLLCVFMVVPHAAGQEAQAPLASGDDLSWALDLEDKIADNIWNGQVYEVDYTSGLPFTRENIRSVNHYGDSALWTGTYLAAQSFRYQVATKKIAELEAQLALPPACKKKKLPKCPPPRPDPIADEISFWQGQKDEAKSRIDQMVAQFHVLVNISESWSHEFAPSAEQPGFGGGVFAGEPGYLMRACIPTSTPEFARWSDAELQPPPGMSHPYTRNRRVFGPLEWRDGTTYWCENGTSRDAYAGTTFGLLTAFDLVSQDDPAMRTQLRDDIITLVNFAVKYGWSTPRPHGRISLPLGLPNPPCNFCGHDFENFISPLFQQVPLARLNMANAAQHVAHAAPGRSDVAKWDAVWTEELATQLPVLAGSMQFDAFQPNESYYKYNLHHLTGYNITRTAENDALRTAFKQALSVMDKTTGDDLNAHFEAITYGLTGDQSRLDAAVTHLRQWRDYRTEIDKGLPINNEKDCGTTIECVQRDQMEIIFDGAAPIVTPGTTGKRARRPLPVGKRTPTDFLWQRPPTQLNGFEGQPLHQAPGIDYLLPYWMLRYNTEVAPPALDPFPAWPGPAHA